MAVNGGHAGTKKGPNWGHVTIVLGRADCLEVADLGAFLGARLGAHLGARILGRVFGHALWGATQEGVFEKVVSTPSRNALLTSQMSGQPFFIRCSNTWKDSCEEFVPFVSQNKKENGLHHNAWGNSTGDDGISAGWCCLISWLK